MGRVKANRTKRVPYETRIERRKLQRDAFEAARTQKRTAFVEVFGDTMTQAERDHFVATGEFNGSDDDGVVPEPIAQPEPVEQ